MLIVYADNQGLGFEVAARSLTSLDMVYTSVSPASSSVLLTSVSFSKVASMAFSSALFSAFGALLSFRLPAIH